MYVCIIDGTGSATDFNLYNAIVSTFIKAGVQIESIMPSNSHLTKILVWKNSEMYPVVLINWYHNFTLNYLESYCLDYCDPQNPILRCEGLY